MTMTEVNQHLTLGRYKSVTAFRDHTIQLRANHFLQSPSLDSLLCLITLFANHPSSFIYFFWSLFEKLDYSTSKTCPARLTSSSVPACDDHLQWTIGHRVPKTNAFLEEKSTKSLMKKQYIVSPAARFNETHFETP